MQIWYNEDMITKDEYLEEHDFATILDTDVCFVGTVETKERTLIKGTISNSKVKASLLVIVNSGRVSGDIESDVVSVLGEFNGDLQVHNTLQLLKGGRIYGKVNTKNLVVGEGGIFNGDCVMIQDKKNPKGKS